MSGSLDPYKVLGLGRNASLEEIRQAYRRAATKYHPDAGGDAAGGDAWAFQQVQQAYDQLRTQHEQAPIAPPQTAGSSTRANNATTSKSTTSKSTNSKSTNSKSTNSKSTNSKSTNAKSTNAKSTKSRPSGSYSTKPETETNKSSGRKSGNDSQPLRNWRHWLVGKPLLLHNETSYFIFANFMDLVMTAILLRYSAVEANPVANFFYLKYGFVGMAGLKIAAVAVVCVVTQSIARRNEFKARMLLVAGSLLVSAVVVYSIFLARNQLPHSILQL